MTNAVPAAALFVPTLPTLPAAAAGREFEVSAGYLGARAAPDRGGPPRDNAHLYFMLHRAIHTPTQRKLIVWMNGGPGCSSFDGAMMEVGAWRFRDSQLVWTQRGGGWNEFADVLYLDQPVGTGYSFVENDAYASSFEQVTKEFVFAMEQFVEIYPEYAYARHGEHGPGGAVDVYLAGESYAGQFIPYFADALLKAKSSSPFMLRGIAIGNGYMDPVSQYGTEVETMVQQGIWKAGGAEVRTMEPVVAACRAAIAKDAVPRIGYPVCDDILYRIMNITSQTIDGQQYCVNTYDLRRTDTFPACGRNWPREMAPVTSYLRREDVRESLHIDPVKAEAWVECSPKVSRTLAAHAEKAASSVTLLPGLLEAGLPVLIFAGDKDLICNALGLERMVHALRIHDEPVLNQTHAQSWRINGDLVGTWQSAKNLTYAKIANASHMVGYDRPFAAHDMMLRFMHVDMNLPANAAALNTSTVGLDARVLVPDYGKTRLGVHPAARENVSVAQEAAAAAPPPPPPLPTEHLAAYGDWAGNGFVIFLIAMAVLLCLALRRRSRSMTQSYQAVGQHVVAGLPSSERATAQEHAEESVVEMEPFMLGDEDDVK
ncbi:carboxypeptidase D [Malassezia vespertilionis]|uniref:Carboxypeptidase n=1 Tax=Malassezia vespertilionis TaxID=2020962 RepID=A0A2N1JD23_9BASI|nr:carboxypeptidase D [Malassezia vespertilionis]PKI84446.1 Kex1p [Malassezia vespertilionis]WFD06246.1 carboxypeptidase D [Malassezia vespertilionis]